MKSNTQRPRGHEPMLGGRHGLFATGMEPSLSRNFRPHYGQFRVRGLEAPQVVGRRRPLILLASIHPDLMRLVKLIAESNGYEIRTTDTSSQLWQWIGEHNPDMMVVSQKLSDSNSLDLIRRIRGESVLRRSELPILIMDSRADLQDIIEAFRAGTDDYLEIPYELPVLLRCFRRIVLTTQRPAPLIALQNENAKVREVALSFLLQRQPEGLVEGLSEMLWSPDYAIYLQVRHALKHLGSDEANAALQRFDER